MTSSNDAISQKEQWVEDAKARIKNLKKSHTTARYQQELAIETTHRDSRYSNTLLDLMRQEEALILQYQSVSSDANYRHLQSIQRQVDEALREETQDFFMKNTQHNMKTWAALQERLGRSRQHFKQYELFNTAQGHYPPPTTDTKKEANSNSNSSSSSSSSSNYKLASSNHRPISSEDLDAEAERLEADYNRKWLLYEGFNLKEAFRSQNLRVDRDWQVHEHELSEDYKTRRNKIAPHQGSQSSSANHATISTAVDGSDLRWHSAEKQKRLIHTAPVLAPSSSKQSPQPDSNPNHHAHGKMHANTSLELEKLDREFNAAMRSLEKQKADARRWLSRQQLRLMAQAEEVQKEKALVADIMDSQIHYFHLLLESVDRAKDKKS